MEAQRRSRKLSYRQPFELHSAPEAHTASCRKHRSVAAEQRALLSIAALGATIYREDFRPGIYGVGTFLVLGMVYYLLYSRHKLVAQAP